MVKFRKFEPSDLPEIVKIAKVSFPKNRITGKSFEKYYRTYPDGFMVGEELGEIVGYIIGQFKNEIGEIASLAVKPISRQKGVGSGLVKSLTENFKNEGFKEIFLHIKASDNSLLLFFQNLDFKVLNKFSSAGFGAKKKKYYKKQEDAILLGKTV